MFKTRSSRYFVLQLGVFLLLVIAGVRLFNVQIVNHQKYVTMANKERVKAYTLEAKRGEIYMMNGKNAVTPVVMNERTWLIFVDPSYVADKNAVQVKLTEILGDQMITTWDKVWADMTRGYVEVAKHVSYETALKVKEANLRGVGRKETSRRVYPAGSLAAQVLGFINAEGVGSGVEGSLNDRLSGEDGLLKTVTDVNLIPLSIGDENVEIPAKDGETIVLTLDENVQRKVEKVLKEHVDKKSSINTASALVLDPQSGKVLAMANYPTYNPEEYWKVTDPYLFSNRVTEQPYEPASVCKPFTYAAALNEGVIKPTDTYNNTGSTKVGDRIIHNASLSTPLYGNITFRKALDYSFNTGSIEVLRRMGGGTISKSARTTLYNYLTTQFGLGARTGIELYEATGVVISPENEEGNAVRYANMTFGQGMNLTMIQVAAGFASLINGGYYYQPTIVAGVMKNDVFIPDEPRREIRQTIKNETSSTMRSMLQEVRSVNGGKNDKKGYEVGVKTGTAETYDEKGVYTSDKTVAGALGYGGSAAAGATPEYVIMIRLDGSTLLWGSQDAVPIFTEISNYMLEYLRIEPNN